MSHDEDVQISAPAETAQAAGGTVEAQDAPQGHWVDECPVCGQGGTAYAKAHGAGTRIDHPRRVFPCSTSTVLEPDAVLNATPTG